MDASGSHEWPPAHRRRGAKHGVRQIRALVTLGALGALGLAGCSSTSAPTTSSTSPTAATVAQIRTNWIAFFNGKTGAAEKIRLLENGEQFAAVIRAQATSTLARSTTATVAKVTLLSQTTARVRYSISVGGQPALADQTGRAVRVGNTWKVGTASFCALLGLQGSTPPNCPK